MDDWQLISWILFDEIFIEIVSFSRTGVWFYCLNILQHFGTRVGHQVLVGLSSKLPKWSLKLLSKIDQLESENERKVCVSPAGLTRAHETYDFLQPPLLSPFVLLMRTFTRPISSGEYCSHRASSSSSSSSTVGVKWDCNFVRLYPLLSFALLAISALCIREKGHTVLLFFQLVDGCEEEESSLLGSYNFVRM